MKPIEILSALPQWAKASPQNIFSSPAWAMPCRLGDNPCMLRHDETRPEDVLPLAVRFEDEDHTLGLTDSPAFPELHSVWNARADVPEQILLALVEKDCGAFLQLLENAARRQLKIVGIKDSSPEGCECLKLDGDAPVSFTLDLSPMLVETFGQLRNIDTGHPSITDATIAAEVEYASFALSAAELSSLAPGDALLLPEIGSLAPHIVADGRFALSENGLSPWKDEGLLRVCAALPSGITLGTLFNATEDTPPQMPQPPQENAPLKLVRFGKTVAHGHLINLAGQPAFTPDTPQAT